MRKLEITNVEATLEKQINKEGKIWGLKEWANRSAIIVIVKGDKDE